MSLLFRSPRLLQALEPLQRALQLAARLVNNESLPQRVRAAAFKTLTQEMADELHACFCGAMEDATKRAAITESLEWLLRIWGACSTKLDPRGLLESARLLFELTRQHISASVCREWLTGAEAPPVPPAALEALLPALKGAMRGALCRLSAAV